MPASRQAFTELMARLGYDRYGVQGGDIGAFVAPLIGRVDAGHVIGVHVNALVTFPSGDPAELEGLTEPEQGASPGCRTASRT